MNREDIIQMAREAGFVLHAYPDKNWLKLMARFAALVAAAEREACAIAGGSAAMAGLDHLQVAAAIRSRGEVKP